MSSFFCPSAFARKIFTRYCQFNATAEVCIALRHGARSRAYIFLAAPSLVLAWRFSTAMYQYHFKFTILELVSRLLAYTGAKRSGGYLHRSKHHFALDTRVVAIYAEAEKLSLHLFSTFYSLQQLRCFLCCARTVLQHTV